jgi:hypothetical protein
MAKSADELPGHYDMGARPETYFDRKDVQGHVLTHVRGQFRRDAVEMMMKEGGSEDLPVEMLSESVDDSVRRAMASAHPMFMSGEYLPPLLPGEVEIARVILRSITGDVMSVRARPSGSRIAYRVVDEYWDGGLSPPYRKRTLSRPMTLGELVGYLETCCDGGILEGWLEYNLEGGASLDELTYFVRAESAFYPDLARLVRWRTWDWVEARREERAREEGEEGRGDE